MAKYELRDIRPKKQKQGIVTKEAPSEYTTAWETWKAQPTAGNMGVLLDKLSPILQSSMRTYGGGSDNLYGNARILAINAAKKYDPKTGMKFRTFLMNELKGLSRYAIQEMEPIKKPERVLQDSHRIQRMSKEFTRRYRREPNITELADATGLSAKRIMYVNKIHTGFMTESTFTSAAGDPISPGVFRVSPEQMTMEYVYHDLDPIDKLVFDYRFGRHGKKQCGVVELANRLKISPSAVSQRAAKISGILNDVRQHVT